MSFPKMATIALMILTGVSGCLVGGCSSPATAQSDRDVMSRLAEINRRLARIEAKLADGRTISTGRWQKIRDNGTTVVLIDSETGAVKFVNTANGTVHNGRK